MPTTTIDNSSVNQVYVRESNFVITCEIIKSNNTNVYLKGQLVNNALSTVLPNFNFSPLGLVANKNITIRTITVMSNNGGILAISPIFSFYKNNTIIGLPLTDNSAFNPSYSENKIKLSCTIEPLKTIIPVGNLNYIIGQNELIRIGTLDSSNRIYFAMATNEEYIPIANEKFYITIKGYLD
jgi:hypothetical protein